MSKVLSVIDSAYRASLEEQDDAGLWFSGAVKNAGADITVLLTGNAVNYVVTGHSAKPLSMAGGQIPHPMDPGQDIRRMADKGSSFYYLREDAEARGLVDVEKMDGVTAISRSELPTFIDGFDHIWHW